MMADARAADSARFQIDVIWNIASQAIMGICGIALMVLVGRYYDDATLGVFNQVFAAYILTSQLAVAGLHYSVLKYVAQHAESRPIAASILIGSLIPAAALAALFTVLFIAAADPVAGILDSEDVAVGMRWVAPGLFFFAINKVLLGALNGLRRMRVFAVLQALRPVLMIVTFAIAAMLDAPGAMLPIVFSVAELTVFILAVGCLLPHLHGPWENVGGWIRRSVDFGVRSFASGVLVELNTRVDVLMLGYFAADALVGVYSFAAIFAEGFFQLLVVLRNNYNPVLVKLLHERDDAEFRRIVRKGKLVAWLAMLAITIPAVAIYPLGVEWVVNADEFMASWPLFAILMAGIVVSAGYMPFNQLLLVAGRPGAHTLLMIAVVAFNIVLNAALIPLLSAHGAATATALSFVFYAGMLIVLSRKLAGVRL